MIIWLADSTPPPDPEQLARQAVRNMRLKPITIGIAPNDDPDSAGLVGMPIWLRADSPSDQTMGPISRSASEGGYTVTATAEVERVRWSMCDGGVKTCSSPATGDGRFLLRTEGRRGSRPDADQAANPNASVWIRSSGTPAARASASTEAMKPSGPHT